MMSIRRRLKIKIERVTAHAITHHRRIQVPMRYSEGIRALTLAVPVPLPTDPGAAGRS